VSTPQQPDSFVLPPSPLTFNDGFFRIDRTYRNPKTGLYLALSGADWSVLVRPSTNTNNQFHITLFAARRGSDTYEAAITPKGTYVSRQAGVNASFIEPRYFATIIEPTLRAFEMTAALIAHDRDCPESVCDTIEQCTGGLSNLAELARSYRPSQYLSLRVGLSENERHRTDDLYKKVVMHLKPLAERARNVA
jgi:hypothetical protein